MLHKPVEKVEAKDGAVFVTSEGETVKAKQVIGDPSYFTDRYTLWLFIFLTINLESRRQASLFEPSAS